MEKARAQWQQGIKDEVEMVSTVYKPGTGSCASTTMTVSKAGAVHVAGRRRVTSPEPGQRGSEYEELSEKDKEWLLRSLRMKDELEC